VKGSVEAGGDGLEESVGDPDTPIVHVQLVMPVAVAALNHATSCAAYIHAQS
jgi:hypothetical protein